MAVGTEPRTTNPSGFEDELSAISAQDHKALQETEELERMHGLQEQANQERQQSRITNIATNMAKKYGEKVVKTAAKNFLRAQLANPVVWIAAAILFLIIGSVLIGLMTTVVACNKPEAIFGGGLKGKIVVFGARVTQKAVDIFVTGGMLAYMEDNICKYVRLPEPASTDVQPPTRPVPAAGQDLVAITGIPTSGSLDARLRPCMLAHVQLVYRQAQRLGINFQITSAYRPGAYVAGSNPPRLSSHSRGEAVDVQIVPPGSLQDPVVRRRWMNDDDFQKKINTLVGLFESEGFRPAPGDTLDEYNHPTEGATGGHIHVEYNSPVNGNSYCTNPTNYDD
jgi:hypothetical protein